MEGLVTALARVKIQRLPIKRVSCLSAGRTKAILIPSAPKSTSDDSMAPTGRAAGANSTSGSGISNSLGNATHPRLAANGGKLHLIWSNSRLEDKSGDEVVLFARQWNGSEFVEQISGRCQRIGHCHAGVKSDGRRLGC